MTSTDRDYLAFRLPSFHRVAWVSDAARGLWEARLEAVREAWSDLELRSTHRGLRPCASSIVSALELPAWMSAEAAAGCGSMAVRALNTEGGGAPTGFQMVSGPLEDCLHFVAAANRYDHQEMGRLLGYPECCTEFYARFIDRNPGRDPMWTIARRGATDDGDLKHIEVGQDGRLNILCKIFRIRATPHLPCGFDCAVSLRQSETFLGLAEELGHAREIRWLREILSWPVEWTALHGIAELKTPVFKLITGTDATASKYVVRYLGTKIPAEGARGLDFPYAVPEELAVSDSVSFARGLKNPL